MSNRVVLVFVGVLFSIYCLVIAILSFIGLNFATFHLSSFLIAGYAAIYGVLSPIGLSGILGGLHRKKSLIKGFMYQYWFASGLMIGINVANVILSDKFRANAIRKCQSALFGVVSDSQKVLNMCTSKVQKSEGVALIFTSVQGAVLILVGFLVLFFGIKEFKDIILEEETKSLLEKAKFQEDSRNSMSDNESNASGSNNANSNAADGGRYPASASVSRASSRSDHGRFTQNSAGTNVSREPSSRSDRERFAQKVNAVPASYAGPNRPQTPGASYPYSTPANNVSNSRINVSTNRGAPPGKYQPPPGHYQSTTPKNAYPASNKNNNYVSSSNKNNYASTSSKNNYPPSSNKSNYPPSSSKSSYPTSGKKNYPPSNKNNSSPIIGSIRTGPNPPNAKLINYSSQPLPLPVTSPERSYTPDRYGPQTSNSSSYSAPIANYAGKSSMRQPMMPPSSNRNYPSSTRPPANINYYPPPVSANRSQQKIKKGYQASANDYDYTNDYNDYIIPSDNYITYAQPR